MLWGIFNVSVPNAIRYIVRIQRNCFSRVFFFIFLFALGLGDERSDAFTQLRTSSGPLNAVWQLMQHTINAAALDLNTDSNTRQRDLCTLDAFLAARYQGGVSPTAARHLRRRVVQNMFQPNGYVNFWSEFLVAHVFALADYTDDYGDVGVATQLWDTQQDVGDGTVYNISNYSLWTYTNASGDGMVYRTPKPLVDWPRSGLIDTDVNGASVCNVHCVQMQVWAHGFSHWFMPMPHTQQEC
eukprot:m.973281 g.973281  ORF g.973281 m.973281 type:complete len:241 (+) comp23933_c0_seq15:216-938(+)